MTFNPELFAQEGDKQCAPHNLKPCLPVGFPPHKEGCELENVWDYDAVGWKACPCEA